MSRGENSRDSLDPTAGQQGRRPFKGKKPCERIVAAGVDDDATAGVCSFNTGYN